MQTSQSLDSPISPVLLPASLCLCIAATYFWSCTYYAYYAFSLRLSLYILFIIYLSIYHSHIFSHATCIIGRTDFARKTVYYPPYVTLPAGSFVSFYHILLFFIRLVHWDGSQYMCKSNATTYTDQNYPNSCTLMLNPISAKTILPPKKTLWPQS